MAHFAQLDENGFVIGVIVINNNELLDNGQESESKGEEFCKSLFGSDTKWKQTSYNSTFRKNFAGVGFKYDEYRDAFIAPKPYLSWVLNQTTCQWEAPVKFPEDGERYIWDDYTNTWVALGNEVPIPE